MNPKKFFIVADTKKLRIGYFYAESVFKYLKRNMKTLINMVELGKVRRNRLSQKSIVHIYLFMIHISVSLGLSVDF